MTTRKAKVWTALAGAAMLLGGAGLGAAAPAAAAAGGGVIKVGVTGPLSGNYASAGIDILNAAKLAANAINAKGGVLGEKIQIIGQDDACDAQTATQAAQKLVDEGVVAVAGGYCSSASLPELSVFHKAGLPFILDASTNPQLTEEGYNDVFRVIGRDDEQGPFAARFIATYLHAKTAAVIDDNSTYALGLAQDTVAALKKLHVRVVYFNAITPGEKDYTSVLTTVKALNPAVIYYTGYFSEAGILVKEARQLGYKGYFMGGDATNDPTLIKTAGAAANGMMITTAPLAAELGARGFINAYEKAYHQAPGPYSVYEYDAIDVLAQAIKNAHSTSPKAIIAALHKIQHFQGLTGDIGFRANGDRIHPAYITIIVKNEQFAPFKKQNAQGTWVNAG